MASIPAIELNDGSKCPLLGLGTYGSEESGDRDKIVQAVYDAIVAGYRHFDTAYCYEVEDKVGEGIKKALDEGLVKRDDLFVVTKIWSTKHRPEKVAEQARESLKALGLDYVDLMLIHWPVSLKDFVPEGAKGMAKWMPANEDGTPMEDTEVDVFTETWSAMEKLKEEGLAKSIGVSNFNTKQIAKLLETAKVKPSMNQVESSPFLTQEKLASVCKEHGITLTAYSPFGGSPRPDKDGVVGDTKTRQSLFENETVKKLADKYGKKPSQILLKFHVQRGVVTIPKSVTKERIIENADIFDFELTEEELASLIALNKNERIVYPEVFKSCKNFPFDEE